MASRRHRPSYTAEVKLCNADHNPGEMRWAQAVGTYHSAPFLSSWLEVISSARSLPSDSRL